MRISTLLTIDGTEKGGCGVDVFSDMIIRSGIDMVESLIKLDFPKVSVDMKISEAYEEFGHSLEYVYVLNNDGLLVGLLDQETMMHCRIS